MTGKNLYLVLYTAVTLICVFISVYLSYYGYYSHFEHLTLMFSVVIGLLLFGADMLIRQFRITQRSLVLPLVFFVVIAGFSGASNFNYLYTQFMAEDIAERDIEGLFETYRGDLTNTRQRITSNATVAQTLDQRNALDRELQNLRRQITDPRRPGCGVRCRSHMETIEEILGGTPTELKIPSVEAPMEEQLAWFDRYRDTVITDFEDGAAPQKYRQAMQLVDEINGLLEKYSNPHQLLRAEGGIAATIFLGPTALDLPQQLRQTSYNVERKANTILSNDNQVSHAPLRSGLDTIGEIPASFKDAFGEMPNPGVTIVSALLAVFVDIAPIFFAFILFGPEARAAQGDQARKKHSSRVATY